MQLEEPKIKVYVIDFNNGEETNIAESFSDLNDMLIDIIGDAQIGDVINISVKKMSREDIDLIGEDE